MPETIGDIMPIPNVFKTKHKSKPNMICPIISNQQNYTLDIFSVEMSLHDSFIFPICLKHIYLFIYLIYFTNVR